MCVCVGGGVLADETGHQMPRLRNIDSRSSSKRDGLKGVPTSTLGL